MLDLPRPSDDLDAVLLHDCEEALSTVELSVGKMLDQHSRDISLGAMSLLNSALQQIRIAQRILHPKP